MTTIEIVARLEQIKACETEIEWWGNITKGELDHLFKLELVEWTEPEYFELTCLGELVLAGATATAATEGK